MIKLSMFMLDPVKAYEQYIKEMNDVHGAYAEVIEKLQKTIDKQTKKNATLKHEMKRILKGTNDYRSSATENKS